MTTTDFNALQPIAGLASQAWQASTHLATYVPGISSLAKATAHINADDIVNFGAQQAIKNMTPDQALDFLAEQSPNSQNLINAVRDNPKMAEALHNAMSNDATVIAGFRKLGDAEGSSLNADSLANAIKDPALGEGVRNAMTQVLNAVGKDGTGGLDFDYLVEVGQNATNYMEDPKNTGKFNLLRNSLKKGNIVSPEVEQAGFFHDLWNNPRGALTNLVSGLNFLPESFKNVLVGLGELVTKFFSTAWDAGPMAFYNDPAAQRLGNKLLDLGADVRREEAKSSPAQRAQDEISAQGNAPGAMQGQAAVHNEGMEGAGARANLAETFGLERDAQGKLSVPDATAERLREMDAQYASRTSGPMMAGI